MISMTKSKSLGFSLIELMIALAIGLVVVGAVLAFTLSSVTTNSEYIQSTRLSQELRNSMDFVSRELRRAGYDQNVGSYVASVNVSTPTISPFSRLFVTNDTNGDGSSNDACVLYAYDLSGGNPGVVNLATGEIRGVRRAIRTIDGQSIGVLEIAQSAASVTPSCNGSSPSYSAYPATCSSSGWCALSDPRAVNITSFTLDVAVLNQNVSSLSTPITMREVGIGMKGELLRSVDGTVERGIRSNVKVRADCLAAVATCALPPSGI
jgi:prepilin-type N-terminal cleavage/methylation domain-containing protein